MCGRCGVVTAGQLPPGVTGRAQYGPKMHAQAANLASAHHVPVARAAELMGAVTGVNVSSGSCSWPGCAAATANQDFLAFFLPILGKRFFTAALTFFCSAAVPC